MKELKLVRTLTHDHRSFCMTPFRGTYKILLRFYSLRSIMSSKTLLCYGIGWSIWDQLERSWAQSLLTTKKTVEAAMQIRGSWKYSGKNGACSRNVGCSALPETHSDPACLDKRYTRLPETGTAWAAVPAIHHRPPISLARLVKCKRAFPCDSLRVHGVCTYTWEFLLLLSPN